MQISCLCRLPAAKDIFHNKVISLDFHRIGMKSTVAAEPYAVKIITKRNYRILKALSTQCKQGIPRVDPYLFVINAVFYVNGDPLAGECLGRIYGIHYRSEIAFTVPVNDKIACFVRLL